MSPTILTMNARQGIDIQHANEFITNMLTTGQKSALSVALTQAAGVLSQTGASLDDCLFDLTIAAENCLYEQHLKSGSGVDVMRNTPILTRTSADPHAIRSLSERTLENRRNAFQKVYRHVSGTKGSPQQPYVWIHDVAKCCAAVCACWSAYSSWKLNAFAFANMVEALGERDLANEYRRRFLAMEGTRKKTKARPKEPLTMDELSLIHKSTADVGRKALKLVQNTTDLFQPSRSNQLAVVQHALVLLLTYGTSKDWSNQRRACLSYDFKHPETDVRADNYIECTDGSVKIVVNTATKVRKTVTIDVTVDCPLLAELLTAINKSPGRPKYILNQYSWRCRKNWGTPLADPSCYNARLKEAVQFAGLHADLCRKSGGCNAARHADVQANRKRPALTQVERSEEKAKAQKRLSSVTAAETQYDQPSSS